MGALQRVDIPSPAFYGQAKDRRDFPLGPEWATKADNVVIDASGRISARKGWEKTDADQFDSGADTVSMFNYVEGDGTNQMIWPTETDIFHLRNNPTSIVGALTPTAGNWQFINFNGKCLAWQADETPIVYTGAGNFADITASTGTLPDGNAACSAFGRVWALDDDGQTIRYCALLDETKWAVADGGGSIDMRTVWTQGMDDVIAIAAFGSNLVVFGRRHIIIWSDGSGSQNGMNPLNMYVTDTIDNVGLVARDAFTVVGEVDIVFWSSSGIRSLVRTMQERASPVTSMSPNNRDYIATALEACPDAAGIKTAYSPELGLVLFLVPGFDTIFVFDVRQATPDGGFRMTEWQMSPMPTAICHALKSTSTAPTILFGFGGFLGSYSGYLDDTATYDFLLESGWVDIKGESGRKQALKALKAFMYCEAAQAVNFRWGVDFNQLTESVSKTVGESITVAEWGEAEWGLAEWGPAGRVIPKRAPLRREAEFFRLRLNTTINDHAFAVQPLTLYSKPMRLA